jgi:VWFA-related protein
MILSSSRVMHNRAHIHTALFVLAIVLGIAVLSSFAFAQAPPREKPILKDFGSSVRKLKWDPERKAAVPTRSESNTRTTQEDEVVRIETSLVICDVSVLDQKGQAVQGLRRADFDVSEDNKPQRVDTFLLGDSSNVPRSIVLLIDYSGSQFPYINTSIEAAKTLVDKLGPLDRMTIVTDDVEMLLDFTADKKKLKEKLENLRKRSTSKPSRFGLFRSTRFGLSSQYSALMATLKETFDSEDQRPIVVFQTDGDEAIFLRDPLIVPYIAPDLPPDRLAAAQEYAKAMEKYQRENLRQFSLTDVYKAAESSRATIYTVIPGFRLMGLSPEDQIRQLKAASEQKFSAWAGTFGRGQANQMKQSEEDRWQKMTRLQMAHEIDDEVKLQSALAEVSTLTGGWTSFLEQPTQAEEIYSRIFSDINRRYVIGYYSTNKDHDGKRRKVNVEVRGHPDYVVTGRKSYLAPQAEP